MLITCRRCSQEKEAHHTDQHLCVDCVKAENNRLSHYRRHNFNWIEVSKEANLELWERQPAETDHEYNVWLHFRDAYPGKKPSYRMVAEELGITSNAVHKIGTRWDFPVRLQAWAKHIDEITLAQRRQEILDMNKGHITMATMMRDKLMKAIESLDPYVMSPREVVSMAKLATELERKARLDDVPMLPVVSDDSNPDLKKANIKTESIGEVVDILAKAGLLDKHQVGVRQTVTTEVVVKDDDN